MVNYHTNALNLIDNHSLRAQVAVVRTVERSGMARGQGSTAGKGFFGRSAGLHDGGMAPVPISPRPLNISERAVLEHILSVDFAGVAALRGQLDRVEVVATWAAGSPSIDLVVRKPVARASLPGRLVPVDAQVLDPSGEYVGELLVWVEDGAVLAGLEYAWITDEPPLHLPAIENIQVTADPRH
jgi:hypothetical protein